MTAERRPTDDVAAFQAFVRGRVQGVGFRVFVERKAQDLGVGGYVRNLGDGTSVEVVAEGPRSKLDSLLGDLQRGPNLAHVERVEVRWIEPRAAGFQGFTVR